LLENALRRRLLPAGQSLPVIRQPFATAPALPQNQSSRTHILCLTLAGNISSVQQLFGVRTHFLLKSRERLGKGHLAAICQKQSIQLLQAAFPTALPLFTRLACTPPVIGEKITKSGKVATRSKLLSRLDYFPSHSQKGLGKQPKPMVLMGHREPTGSQSQNHRTIKVGKDL